MPGPGPNPQHAASRWVLHGCTKLGEHHGPHFTKKLRFLPKIPPYDSTAPQPGVFIRVPFNKGKFMCQLDHLDLMEHQLTTTELVGAKGCPGSW